MKREGAEGSASGRYRPVCILLWALSGNVLAWGPNSRDLEAAIASGEFGRYLANLTAWLDSKATTQEDHLRKLLDDPAFINALDQRQLIFETGPEQEVPRLAPH